MILDEMKQCVICDDNLLDMGHNPYPLFTNGRCCEFCNDVLVLPARISAHYKDNKSKDEWIFIRNLYYKS